MQRLRAKYENRAQVRRIPKGELDACQEQKTVRAMASNPHGTAVPDLRAAPKPSLLTAAILPRCRLPVKCPGGKEVAESLMYVKIMHKSG